MNPGEGPMMMRQMLLMLLLMVSSVLAQTDYFVDAVNGDDANPGTFDEPIKTLDKASSDDGVGGASGTGYVDGDKILLKRGQAHPGTLLIRRDGSKLGGATGITIGAYGFGPPPKIIPPAYQLDYAARDQSDPTSHVPTTSGIMLLATGNFIIEDIEVVGGAYGIVQSVLNPDLPFTDVFAAPAADKDQGGITIRRCRVTDQEISSILIGFGFFAAIGATNPNSNAQTVEDCFVARFVEDRHRHMGHCTRVDPA